MAVLRMPPRPRCLQLEPQPFRLVVQQVEAALLDPQLPPSVLADNKKVVTVMRQFVKNLEPPGGGYPPPFRHPRVTMVFRCAAAAHSCCCSGLRMLVGSLLSWEGCQWARQHMRIAGCDGVLLLASAV